MNYNYYGKKDLMNGKVYTDLRKTIYRTHWAYPTKPKSYKGKDCQFERVGTKELIIDIDDETNINNALSITIATIEYLTKKYNIDCSAWFSGKKGFHIAIPFKQWIELTASDVGKSSGVVGGYEQLLQELENKIDNASYDHTLNQVTRVIQQANKHKNKQEKDRGYKICIGNNTTIETSIDIIRDFSKQNKNIYEPITDADNNDFKNHLIDLNNKSLSLKTQKDTPRKLKNQYNIEPLAKKLHSIHKDRHTPVIGAIAWCCVDYLNKDEAEAILKQLQTIPIINETNNLVNSFWNAYNKGNNGLGNLYTLLELDTTIKDDKEKKDRQQLFDNFKEYLTSHNPNVGIHTQKMGVITVNNIEIECYLIEDFNNKYLKYEGIVEGINLTLDFDALIGRFIDRESDKPIHSFKFKMKDDFFEIVKFKETTEFLNAEGIEIPKFFQEIIRNNLDSLDKSVFKPKEYPNKETDNINNEIDQEKAKEYIELLKIYDNDPIRLYDNKLKLYLANSENLFKLIIHGLGAYLKLVSRLLILNGGSSGGKSRLAEELGNMMPIFENLSRSTFAYVSGIDEPHFYDGKIFYGGDKGLTIEDQENFEKIMAFLGELATDKYIKKGFRPNNEETVVEFFVDGLLYFVGEPYTNLNTFKASDQMKTRTTYITINPLNKQQSIQLRKAKHQKKKLGINLDEDFETMHRNYISYIMNKPIEIDMPLEYELKILELVNYNDRATDYYVGLFDSYCQYLRISEPSEDDLNTFLDIFYDKYEVTEIEFMVYEKLYRNLRVLTKHEFENEFKDGWNAKNDMLNSTTNRKSKPFFTVKQVKTYFKNDFRANKHLKDVIDSISEILENLFNADLLGRLETASRQENIYYIKYNEELEPKEEQ